MATAAAPSLNVYKKVAVIRHPSDSLTYEDGEGKQKSVSVQELGDAIATAVRNAAHFCRCFSVDQMGRNRTAIARGISIRRSTS